MTTATDTPTTTRGTASFEVRAVGAELPPEEHRATAATNKVYDNLLAIQENPGEWFEVAQYATSNGAKKTNDAITAGERAIPDGEYELEVRTRRVEGRERRGSVLYAKFIG